MQNYERQTHQWQKIVRPPDGELEDEVEKGGGSPQWVRKYLDLADLLIKRVQDRVQRGRVRQRDAA
jgi:hypothetical protein